MPKRPRSHQLEDLSRNRLHQVFEEAGWTVEDLGKDYGEDLLVRIFEDGETTPFAFYVQAKATDRISRYRGRTSNFFRYPLKQAHFKHWLRLQEPVILTLWDSRSDNTYWVCIQNELSKDPSQRVQPRSKTRRISIPRANLIDHKGLNLIHRIARTRYARLETEKQGVEALINLLQQKLNCKIEYSSNGICIIQRGKNQAEIMFFGKTAKVLNEVVSSRKISLNQAFDIAIDRLISDFQEHERTGKFPVINRHTKDVEYIRMSKRQLQNHLKSEIEYLDTLS